MRKLVTQLMLGIALLCVAFIPIFSTQNDAGQLLRELINSSWTSPDPEKIETVKVEARENERGSHRNYGVHFLEQNQTKSNQTSSNQTNYYASFTEKLKIFDNQPQKWGGYWVEHSPQTYPYMANFQNRRGDILAHFEYQEEIKKTFMFLEILDEIYLDASKIALAINLKMSTYDKNTSTFTIKCYKGDEYFAVAVTTEETINQREFRYFDMDFKLSFTDKTTEKPLNLADYAEDHVKITYSLKSLVLGLDISGEMESRDPPQKKKWAVFLIIAVSFILLVFTFMRNGDFAVDFMLNTGFEAIAIIVLFYYHCFCVFIQLGKYSPLYGSLFYILAGLIFIKTFIFEIQSLQFMAMEANIRRPNRDIYYCLMVVLFIILLILIGIFTPRILFSRAYKYYIGSFFVFPILQIFVTMKKAMNVSVFRKGYQIMNWWPTLIYACFIKGVHNEFTNLSPSIYLIYAIAGSLLVGTVVMFLQSILGIYFFVPKKWIIGYYDMTVPLSKVPLEKQTDECPICYFPLKTDPEKAQMEMMELRQDQHGEPIDNQELIPQTKELYCTPCKHYFHVNCLKAWLRTKQSCPICNKEIVFVE